MIPMLSAILIVVMNVDSYREEAIHQLTDIRRYINLRGDPTKQYRATLAGTDQ